MRILVSYTTISIGWFFFMVILIQSCFVPKEFDMPISVICNCVPQTLSVEDDIGKPGEKTTLATERRKQLFLDCLARADFQQKTAFEVDDWKDKIPTTPRKLFYEKVTKNCPEALEFLKLIQEK